MVYEYFCEYTLFFRITLGVDVKLCNYIMQMCSLLRAIFYGIEVVPLATLAAMIIGFMDEREVL